MFDILKRFIATPADVQSDGTLPPTKIAPKAAAVGSMAMASSVVVWGFRMLGVKVGEKEIDEVFAAGLTLLAFAQFLAAYFTKDKLAKTPK